MGEVIMEEVTIYLGNHLNLLITHSLAANAQ
jgi:hypothetical protein